MAERPDPVRSLARHWHMARHVPIRQMVRRASLVIRRRLEPLVPPRLDTRPWPLAASRVPHSVLPPRDDLVRHGPASVDLVMPWGRCRLWPYPDWHPEAPDEASVLLRAALHNMEYLSAVEDATARGLMASWLEHNPFDRRDVRSYAWRPFNLSLRVVAWMRELAKRGARWPEPVVADLHGSLVQQLRYLVRRLETDLRGNHLIKNITALLWAGAFFTGAEARTWRAIGSRLLDAELGEQILDDGCHFERSPTYQCQVMADLLDCWAVLEPGPLRERVRDKLGRMGEALVRLLHPDGDPALLNDGGLHASWPPAAVLTGLAACGGHPEPRVADGPFALPDAGYWGFRSKGEYLVVDCGPLGPDYLVGHGHADILSFEWSTAGRRIVVDQGTFAYAAGPRRTSSRSSASHNVVTIAGAEQSDIYGAHRCGRRAKPRLLDWAADATGIRFRGTHDGFATLPGRPRHERGIVAAPGRLVIHDRILAEQAMVGEARYLLHPTCRILGNEDRSLILACDDVVVEVTASSPLVVQPAEWYPDMFIARTTHRLVCAVPAGEAGARVVFRRR